VQGDAEDSLKASALWDTGAMITCISPRLAASLKLQPVANITMGTPGGIVRDCPQYRLNVHLPNHAEVKHIRAVGAAPSSCDILIGMDVIGLGDFAVSNYGGKTVFSFRTPSAEKIDFTS
jgi:hypothetical protein